MKKRRWPKGLHAQGYDASQSNKPTSVSSTMKVWGTLERENCMLRVQALLKEANALVGPTAHQLYVATMTALREMILGRALELESTRGARARCAVYLCMEFLVGRSFLLHAWAVGMEKELADLYASYGYTLEEIGAQEWEPGLGNGGLGRLAACYLDALTEKGYWARGYSLCYTQGFFSQKIVDGEQVALPDLWMEDGTPYFTKNRAERVLVQFQGENKKELRGVFPRSVWAEPWDLFIPGAQGHVNRIRFWRATAMEGGETSAISAEDITRQLYPPDEGKEGKRLRLLQQYLLVSATLQDLMREQVALGMDVIDLSKRIALHINDTHPAMAIPECLRLFMQAGASWEKAAQAMDGMISYTNHTVLPEALETWGEELLEETLPEIYATIKRYDAYCREKRSPLPIIAEGRVHMARLCVLASHKVNGVSELHSGILKSRVFAPFYRQMPEKFTNVTNGIAHRRWLGIANPYLTSFLQERLGVDILREPEKLALLRNYRKDEETLTTLGKIKLENKKRFAHWLFAEQGKRISPMMLFDVQAKRMHEYKRQLLNLLKILYLYDNICEQPQKDFLPQAFIFAAKAAPGYKMAKRMISMICALERELAGNPSTRDRLRVVFLENYQVSAAEKLIPAAEISEQISLAGKEASGTGNMKFMMNGAVTLGTMDGANIEIFERAGRENNFPFGLSAKEVEALSPKYRSEVFYRSSPMLSAAIDRLRFPIGGESFSDIISYLLSPEGGDPFLCLADFESYLKAHSASRSRYADQSAFCKMSLENIAASGAFSSDKSVEKYAENIWQIEKV